MRIASTCNVSLFIHGHGHSGIGRRECCGDEVVSFEYSAPHGAPLTECVDGCVIECFIYINVWLNVDVRVPCKSSFFLGAVPGNLWVNFRSRVMGGP